MYVVNLTMYIMMYLKCTHNVLAMYIHYMCISVRYKCTQVLTCIQVLFTATTTTTTMYAILDLILLNADTYVSTTFSQALILISNYLNLNISVLNFKCPFLILNPKFVHYCITATTVLLLLLLLLLLGYYTNTNTNMMDDGFFKLSRY